MLCLLHLTYASCAFEKKTKKQTKTKQELGVTKMISWNEWMGETLVYERKKVPRRERERERERDVDWFRWKSVGGCVGRFWEGNEFPVQRVTALSRFAFQGLLIFFAFCQLFFSATFPFLFCYLFFICFSLPFFSFFCSFFFSPHNLNNLFQFLSFPYSSKSTIFISHFTPDSFRIDVNVTKGGTFIFLSHLDIKFWLKSL